MIKRYGWAGWEEFAEKEDGKYVLYEDHLAAIEEKDKEIERLRKSLVEIDYAIKCTHLDMGGKHTYALMGGERGRKAVQLVKAALGGKEDSDATSSPQSPPK